MAAINVVIKSRYDDMVGLPVRSWRGRPRASPAKIKGTLTVFHHVEKRMAGVGSPGKVIEVVLMSDRRNLELSTHVGPGE
jgi:hypothetical protein